MEENNLVKNQEASKDEKKGGFFKKDSKCEKLQAENSELKNDLQRTRADFVHSRFGSQRFCDNFQNQHAYAANHFLVLSSLLEAFRTLNLF